MMLESKGYDVRDEGSLCWKVTVIMLESNGYGVRE
jgi:hypothetical protein